MAQKENDRKPTISYVDGNHNTVFQKQTDREENLGMIRDWLSEDPQKDDPGAQRILEQIEGEINE